MPCNTGTVVAPSPKAAMKNFSAIGTPTVEPNNIAIAVGTILKLYVKSFGSSNSRYLEKFPEIVKITTKVHKIQKGPYKSGLFTYD